MRQNITYLLLAAFAASCTVVLSQDAACTSAASCAQQAFAYAFTTDAKVDDVKVEDAERIQADVRKCFQPCVASARKIAKLSIAEGDVLFDEEDPKASSGRGRGRINKEPKFPKQARVMKPQNDKARGTAAGRGKRQAEEDPGQCMRRVLGQSASDYLEQCLSSAEGDAAPATTTQASVISRLTGRFGNLFGAGRGGRGKRAATSEFDASKDKQGELLYMFAYAKDIAAKVCPDKRRQVLQCVARASAGKVNLINLNPETVKTRYCEAQTQCQAKSIECEKAMGAQTLKVCSCQSEIKKKVGQQCEMLPSPCDGGAQQDAPQPDTAGTVCEANVPTADYIVDLVRARHGAKINKSNGRGTNNGRGNGRG